MSEGRTRIADPLVASCGFIDTAGYKGFLSKQELEAASANNKLSQEVRQAAAVAAQHVETLQTLESQHPRQSTELCSPTIGS